MQTVRHRSATRHPFVEEISSRRLQADISQVDLAGTKLAIQPTIVLQRSRDPQAFFLLKPLLKANFAPFTSGATKPCFTEERQLADSGDTASAPVSRFQQIATFARAQPRRFSAGGTPNRWMRSRIAVNNSLGTANSAI